MAEEPRTVLVERRIAAPPTQLFAMLTDLRRHADLDGSGMVRGFGHGPGELSLGEEFIMVMRQHRLDYRSVSTVIEYERDRLITWQSVGRWRGRTVIGGQWWRYRLIPDGEHTLVQHSYLWGKARWAMLTIWLPGYPRRMERAMRTTLENLAAEVEGGAGGPSHVRPHYPSTGARRPRDVLWTLVPAGRGEG